MQNELMYLFPDAKPGDWHAQDDSDGKGPYIKAWNRPEPQPTLEQLVAIAEPARVAAFKVPSLNSVRTAREAIMSRLDGIAGRAYRAGDTVTAAACDKALVALTEITTLPAVLAASNEAQLKTAITVAYAQIVAVCPPNILSAFRGMNK